MVEHKFFMGVMLNNGFSIGLSNGVYCVCSCVCGLGVILFKGVF